MATNGRTDTKLTDSKLFGQKTYSLLYRSDLINIVLVYYQHNKQKGLNYLSCSDFKIVHMKLKLHLVVAKDFTIICHSNAYPSCYSFL